MTILSVENLCKSHRHEPVFEDVTFGMAEGDRVGLIGANGSGKSTLLRIVAGEDEPDSGRVMLAGNPVVGYLSQNPALDDSLSVIDAIFSGSTEAMRLLNAYEVACAAMATGDAQAAARASEISARLEAMGAWELETNARVVLSRLGIDNVDARLGELSGGQRKRVALAHALIERPDLLILDEPTNHLDAETIEWLEDYLEHWRGALLLVTHDRYFLDRVTSRILELDGGRMVSYNGSYRYYLEKKEEDTARRGVEAKKRDALIRQERAWLLKGAKARTTKQKARIERAEALIDAPKEQQRGRVQLETASTRLGSKVLELHHVSKSYPGAELISDFTYIAQPGERLGVIGPNGSGKSTLLEIMAGRLAPDAGRVEHGQTVVVGYYDQESRVPDDGRRVIDVVREVAENVRTDEGRFLSASQMLDRFLFTGAMQYAPVARLSGGERRRLALLLVLMGAPNVLLLDEPTNDLDIGTLMALEDYLDAFSGAVVVVSHDRYFLDRTVEHLFRLDGVGGLREYPGNYSLFLEYRQREREASERPSRRQRVEAEPEGPRTGPPAKLTFKERKELSALEETIAALEERKTQVEHQLGQAGTDYQAAQALAAELSTIERELSSALDRWTELAERNG